jgi:hypothetical protein
MSNKTKTYLIVAAVAAFILFDMFSGAAAVA